MAVELEILYVFAAFLMPALVLKALLGRGSR